MMMLKVMVYAFIEKIFSSRKIAKALMERKKSKKASGETKGLLEQINDSSFLLRGLEKVNIEWGLLSIAHNMAKVVVITSN